MTKKILHLQIPLNNNNKTDDLALSPKLMGQFYEFIEDKLNKDEWIIIVSPFIPSICEDDKFHNFDVKQFDKDELLNLIKEK